MLLERFCTIVISAPWFGVWLTFVGPADFCIFMLRLWLGWILALVANPLAAVSGATR
ncbi:MAG: hypothetical protein ACLT76_10395 [Clostridium fessum]